MRYRWGLRFGLFAWEPSVGSIAAERRSAGKPISQFDCQIAAIARAHEAAVATRNTVDFEGCGIVVIDPWQQSAAGRGARRAP